MTYNPYDNEWVTVHCPVCTKRLGEKKRNVIETFTCTAEGCSDTEHTFYPGQIKRPGKSFPKASYWRKKKTCTCSNCDISED